MNGYNDILYRCINVIQCLVQFDDTILALRLFCNVKVEITSHSVHCIVFTALLLQSRLQISAVSAPQLTD